MDAEAPIDQLALLHSVPFARQVPNNHDAEFVFKPIRHFVELGGKGRQWKILGCERNFQAPGLDVTQSSVDLIEVGTGQNHGPGRIVLNFRTAPGAGTGHFLPQDLDHLSPHVQSD